MGHSWNFSGWQDVAGLGRLQGAVSAAGCWWPSVTGLLDYHIREACDDC